MEQIATILVLGITVEALIEYVKLIFVNKQVVWKQVAALVLGVGLACAAQVNMFTVVGVEFFSPWVGIILTGIIFSRGANYVADFWKLISSKSEELLTRNSNSDE